MLRYSDLGGKVVVVTAAAAGIGAATADAFAEEGARVMLADIDRERGETQEGEVEKLVRATVTSFGGLNVAANVVGDAHPQAAGHGGGAIANVTSLAGLLHVAESGAAYAAAKAGVVRLTKFAAVVYADDAASMVSGHVLPVDGGWTARA